MFSHTFVKKLTPVRYQWWNDSKWKYTIIQTMIRSCSSKQVKWNECSTAGKHFVEQDVELVFTDVNIYITIIEYFSISFYETKIKYNI